MYLFAGLLLLALGVIGCLSEKRRNRPGGMRSFLIWYAMAWPFAAFGVTGMLYRRLHWMEYGAVALAVVNGVWQTGTGARVLQRIRSSRARRP